MHGSRPWAILAILGPCWANLGPIWGLSWGYLGKSWGYLGAILGLSWRAMLGQPWASRGVSGSQPWKCRGVSGDCRGVSGSFGEVSGSFGEVSGSVGEPRGSFGEVPGMPGKLSAAAVAAASVAAVASASNRTDSNGSEAVFAVGSPERSADVGKCRKMAIQQCEYCRLPNVSNCPKKARLRSTFPSLHGRMLGKNSCEQAAILLGHSCGSILVL